MISAGFTLAHAVNQQNNSRSQGQISGRSWPTGQERRVWRGVPFLAFRRGSAMQQMMHDGMMHGPMMWGMGIAWILVLAFLILGIAAFVKYLFFNGKP